jgi:hypothetical protein
LGREDAEVGLQLAKLSLALLVHILVLVFLLLLFNLSLK